MDYEELFQRILAKVDKDAYLATLPPLAPRQRAALQEIERARRDASLSVDQIRGLIARFYEEGRLDAPLYYSALHVLAASPRVKDYPEAARLVAAQEMAALEQGGPRLQANLASVERHRGVLAFLTQHYDVALDYFSRAFEREHNAMNLSNVLSTLLRLGDEPEARALLVQVRASLPPALVAELDELILTDPDLALLRGEVPT